MKPSLLPTTLLAALLLAACTKDDPDPLSQLPPATQTGAGTLGCLVNGQPWTPAGFNGTANFSISYDRALGGSFDLEAYRYQNSDSETLQYLTLDGSRLYGLKSWSIRDSADSRAVFYIRKTNCEWSSRDAGTYRTGTLTITKLDLTQRIIAGTFEFTLAKPGCDTIKVTNGRFDAKF